MFNSYKKGIKPNHFIAGAIFGTGLLLSSAIPAHAESDGVVNQHAEIPVVDVNKNWKVEFNTVIDPESVTDESVYVLDENDEKKRVLYDFETKPQNERGATVLTVDPVTLYDVGDYTLYITKDVTDKEGRPLKQKVEHEFTTQTDKDYQTMTLDELKEEYGDPLVWSREEYGGREMGIKSRSLMDSYYYNQIILGHDFGEPTREFLLNEYAPTIMGVDHYEGRYPRWEIISYDGMAVKNSPIWDAQVFDSFGNLYWVEQSEIKHWLLENPKKSDQFVVDIAIHSEDFATYLQSDVGIGSSNHYENNDALMVNPMEVLADVEGVITTQEDGKVFIEYKDSVMALKSNSKEARFEGKDISLSHSTKSKNGNIFVSFEEVATYFDWTVRESETFGRFQVANFELENLESVESDNEYIQENIR